MSTLRTISEGDSFVQIESVTPDRLYSPFSISLYVLRQANVNDNWKIQAIFGQDLKFDFNDGISLIYPKVSLSNLLYKRNS